MHESLADSWHQFLVLANDPTASVDEDLGIVQRAESVVAFLSNSDSVPECVGELEPVKLAEKGKTLLPFLNPDKKR